MLWHMTSRRAGVTIGLIVATAIVGALCGIFALLPIPLLHSAPSSSDVTFGQLVPWSVGVGALVGAVLGPMLALSFRGPVPLWRLIVDPALGTIVGAFVGWALARNPW